MAAVLGGIVGGIVAIFGVHALTTENSMAVLAMAKSVLPSVVGGLVSGAIAFVSVLIAVKPVWRQAELQTKAIALQKHSSIPERQRRFEPVFTRMIENAKSFSRTSLPVQEGKTFIVLCARAWRVLSGVDARALTDDKHADAAQVERAKQLISAGRDWVDGYLGAWGEYGSKQVLVEKFQAMGLEEFRRWIEGLGPALANGWANYTWVSVSDGSWADLGETLNLLGDAAEPAFREHCNKRLSECLEKLRNEGQSEIEKSLPTSWDEIDRACVEHFGAAADAGVNTGETERE